MIEINDISLSLAVLTTNAKNILINNDLKIFNNKIKIKNLYFYLICSVNII